MSKTNFVNSIVEMVSKTNAKRLVAYTAFVEESLTELPKLIEEAARFLNVPFLDYTRQSGELYDVRNAQVGDAIIYYRIYKDPKIGDNVNAMTYGLELVVEVDQSKTVGGVCCDTKNRSVITVHTVLDELEQIKDRKILPELVASDLNRAKIYLGCNQQRYVDLCSKFSLKQGAVNTLDSTKMLVLHEGQPWVEVTNHNYGTTEREPYSRTFQSFEQFAAWWIALYMD